MAVCHSFSLEQLCLGLITANFNSHNTPWKLLIFSFSEIKISMSVFYVYDLRRNYTVKKQKKIYTQKKHIHYKTHRISFLSLRRNDNFSTRTSEVEILIYWSLRSDVNIFSWLVDFFFFVVLVLLSVALLNLWEVRSKC